METAMNTLSTAINETSLWGEFNKAVPFLTVVVLFSLGVYFIRKLLRGVQKTKARI